MEFAGTSIRRDNISNSGNVTFNLTQVERDLLLSKCPNSNTLTVKYVIATVLSGSEAWWSAIDKTMTVVNANPSFSNFTYQDTNTTVVAVTGNNQLLVKGKSQIRGIISSANKMVANKKATAKNYVLDIDTLNKSANYATTDLNIDLGIIVNSGTKRLNCRAYDSRNNSTLVYKDIVIYEYDKPVINASINRLNNFENQTTLKVSGSFSLLNIAGVNKNSITSLQYRYRETNGTWGSWTNLNKTITNNNFMCTDVILNLDNTKAFEFEVKCVDKLDTTVESLPLDIGQSVFFISSNKKACYINGQEILQYDIVDEW